MLLLGKHYSVDRGTREWATAWKYNQAPTLDVIQVQNKYRSLPCKRPLPLLYTHQLSAPEITVEGLLHHALNQSKKHFNVNFFRIKHAKNQADVLQSSGWAVVLLKMNDVDFLLKTHSHRTRKVTGTVLV